MGGIKEATPYIEVKFKGLRHLLHSEKQEGGNVSTSLLWQQNNPVWNTDFVFHPTSGNDIIQVKVWDKKFLGNNYLGKALIPVSQYLNRGIQESWLPLTGKRGTRASGEVRLLINYGTGSTSFAGQSAYGYGTNVGQNTMGSAYGTNYVPQQAVQQQQPLSSQQFLPHQTQLPNYAQPLGQQGYSQALPQQGGFVAQPQQGAFVTQPQTNLQPGYAQTLPQQGTFATQPQTNLQQAQQSFPGQTIKEVTTTTERVVYGGSQGIQAPANQGYRAQ